MVTVRAAGIRIHTSIAFGLIAAAAALVPSIAGAQQDPNQQGGQPGQPGQGGGRQRRGGFGGAGGAGGGALPFASGTVSGGDPATGTIIINSRGGTQTIHVPNDTRTVALLPIDVSKLQVGDKVQVQGVPKEISANSITAGDMPDFLTAGIRGGRGGAAGAPGAAPGTAAQGNAAAAQPAQPQAFASATGKVTKLQPLTIALSDEISIVLKLGPNAKIMKIMPATINNIKLGDTVFASGAAGADGTFNATGLGINVNMGGMMGGRGMMGGPGGGGFGGAGGGAGAFGGGRAGRGGRGGRGGGANGAGGAGGTGTGA